MGFFSDFVNPVSAFEHSLNPSYYGLHKNPVTKALFGGGTTADTSASDQLARLYRTQWAQYLQNFGPLEAAQVGLLGNKQQAQQRQQTLGDNATIYSKAPSELQRQAFSYGAPLNTEQLQSYKQKLNTQKGLADASAYNSTVNSQTSLAFGGISPQYTPAGVGLGGSAGAVVK